MCKRLVYAPVNFLKNDGSSSSDEMESSSSSERS